MMTVKDRQLELFKVVMDISAEKGPLSIYAIAKEASERLGEDMHKVRMRIMRLIDKLEALGMVKVTRGPRNAKLVDLSPKGLGIDVQFRFYKLFKPCTSRDILTLTGMLSCYKRATLKKLVREGSIPGIALKMPELAEKILNAIKKSLEDREFEYEMELTSDADIIAYNEVADWIADIMSDISTEELYSSTLNPQFLKQHLIAIFKEANLTEEDIRLLSYTTKEEQRYHMFLAKICGTIHEALNELKEESIHEC